VSCAELGGDRREAHRQLLDAEVGEIVLEETAQTVAGDQPRAGDVEIEQPHHPALGQRLGELLEFVELASGIAAADHGADR
jgi:hypothetical protein